MRSIIISVCLLLPFQHLNADEVIRLEFQIGDPLVAGNIKNVDIRLFDTVAPSTTTNFLNYLVGPTTNGGSYNNTFMHRGISNFVIQTGSFTFDASMGAFVNDPVLNDFTGGLKTIIDDGTIPNEFSKSNIRGTMAMAKISARFEDSNGIPCVPEGVNCFLIEGTGVNSATSGWFINVNDNSANLDTANGGFTVFGEVINNTMSVVDTMASITLYDKRDIHLAFGSDSLAAETLPLVGYTSGAITDANLIKLLGYTKLFSITSELDFGVIKTGSSAELSVTINNTSLNELDITTIDIDNTITGQFERVPGNCIASPIPINGSCQFIVRFSPQINGTFIDTVNINFNNISFIYELKLQAQGADILEPEISISENPYDFGFIQVDPNRPFSDFINIVITNDGTIDLNISSVMFGTLDSDDFDFFENCTVNTPLEPGTLCVVTFFFDPVTPGLKEASITVVSDDVDENEVVITAFGFGEIDSDGVPFDHENACSESGDCNYDGIADGVQNNVASLKVTNGEYITLVTGSSNLINVVALDTEVLQGKENAPNIDIGALGFDINNFVSGGNTELGLILPIGSAPKAVYMYGVTSDNPDFHWYDFTYDEETRTGAIIFENVDFTSLTGEKIQRSVATLFFVDGSRGDSDLLANGQITSGVLATEARETTPSSGSLNFLFIYFYLLVIILMKKIYQLKNSKYVRIN